MKINISFNMNKILFFLNIYNFSILFNLIDFYLIQIRLMINE